MQYCLTGRTPANEFTKPLKGAIFMKFSDLIMNSSYNFAWHVMQDHRSGLLFEWSWVSIEMWLKIQRDFVSGFYKSAWWMSEMCGLDWSDILDVRPIYWLSRSSMNCWNNKHCTEKVVILENWINPTKYCQRSVKGSNRKKGPWYWMCQNHDEDQTKFK